VVENVVLLPLTLALAESGGGVRSWRVALAQSLRRLVVNPLILAIGSGFAVAIAGVTLPAPVAHAIDMLSAASAAVALFVIGGHYCPVKPQAESTGWDRRGCLRGEHFR
jgi:predicted permease